MPHHNPVDFSKPEPAEAGPVITLQISGNRLVSLLNTLDSAMYASGDYRLEGNDVVCSNRYTQALRDLCESIRDELSAQRNNTTADDVRASMARVRAPQGWESV